ncbi:MAG: type II secretion system protein GspM [Sedimentisphaerales bacterium]
MRLTKREKQIVICGIVCLGVLIAFQMIVSPAFGRTKTLKRVVSQKRKILADLQVKSKEYNSLKEQLEKIRVTIQNQQKNGKILSSVEHIQKDCGISQNVVNLTPTTTVINDTYERTDIEIKYGAVTLEQLVRLLMKINSSDMLIGIRSLEIQRGLENPALLDAVIRLASVSSVQ